MGRMLLILITGATILFSIAAVNMNSSNLAMVGNAVDDYYMTQAKNYAESGVEFALRQLSDDTAWTGGNTISFGQGSVTISAQTTYSQYANGPNINLVGARLVTSIGNAGGMKDTVLAVLQFPVSQDTSGNVPPFLDYAVATGNNLTMNGNVNIVDDNNPQWNANIHTNAEFQMNGNNMIKGFLTYYSEAHANPAKRLKTNIVPNQNPNNLPGYSQGPVVDIPTFNPDAYRNLATTVYPSNVTFNGNQTLGTKEKPQIIYVGGDLQINGNFNGYAVFIVRGNILVSGNVTVNSGSNLGLYTAGDLNANGNVTLDAQILTGGNANLNGNCKVYGSVTSKGTVNFNGNVNIYYKPATSALTEPLWPSNNNGNTPSRPQIISYYANTYAPQK